MDASPDTLSPLTVTANAAKRIGQIIDDDGKPNLKLRVTVTGGGCSGFQYNFVLDDAQTDDDISIERDGITVLIDSMSLLYVSGSEIDYVDELIGSAFRINNPNATASCGCGTSFAV